MGQSVSKSTAASGGFLLEEQAQIALEWHKNCKRTYLLGCISQYPEMYIAVRFQNEPGLEKWFVQPVNVGNCV